MVQAHYSTTDFGIMQQDDEQAIRDKITRKTETEVEKMRAAKQPHINSQNLMIEKYRQTHVDLKKKRTELE